jgi:hypothetical protein
MMDQVFLRSTTVTPHRGLAEVRGGVHRVDFHRRPLAVRRTETFCLSSWLLSGWFTSCTCKLLQLRLYCGLGCRPDGETGGQGPDVPRPPSSSAATCIGCAGGAFVASRAGWPPGPWTDDARLGQLQRFYYIQRQILQSSHMSSLSHGPKQTKSPQSCIIEYVSEE